jgi:hypothetical protein
LYGGTLTFAPAICAPLYISLKMPIVMFEGIIQYSTVGYDV